MSGDHAARLSGFFLTSRPAFMLSGGHASRISGGFPVAGSALLPGVRCPGFQEVFRGPGARLSGARGPEARSQGPGFQGLSGCFQGTGDRGHASRAFRGQGTRGLQGAGPPPCKLCLLYKIDAARCLQQRPIIYVMSPFPFFPNIPLATENINPCFSTLSRTIFLFWSEMFVFLRLFFSL